MTNIKFRAFIQGVMRDVQAIFWSSSEIVEIRYLDPDDGESVGVHNVQEVPVMQSTGFKSKSGDYIYEGDIVEVEYQYGTSLCVVEWCKIKYSLILRPISGEKPKHKPHFRISGKKGIKILGNIHENPDMLPK